MCMLWWIIKKKNSKTNCYINYNKDNFIKVENREWQFHNFIIDIINTKLYKKKQKEKNVNKFLEAIILPQILNSPDVISLFPFNIQTKKNNPVVTYKLSKTIRNNILNYKEVISWIYTDEEVAFSLNANQSECTSSAFCDSHHDNIITGDLRTIKNNKPRKLLTKGSNYRKLQSISFSRAFYVINTVVNSCNENMATRNKIDIELFQNWKEKMLAKVDKKFKKLKQKLKLRGAKSVLSDPDAKTYLEQLYRWFVVVTIDKVSNNNSFISKKSYITKLLFKVGFSSDTTNKT